MTTLSYDTYEIKSHVQVPLGIQHSVTSSVPEPLGIQHSATLSVPVNILLDNLKYFNFSKGNFMILHNPYEVNINMEFLKRVNNPFGKSADVIPFLFMAGCKILYITADKSFSFYK